MPAHDDIPLIDRIDALVQADGRYRREAYLYIYSALDHTVRSIGRDASDSPAGRHVTGQELARGIAEYGRQQFGPIARAVFASWGIGTTLDFGRIVFSLVDSGLMSKTEQDRLEDFANVYDFEEAFHPRTLHNNLKEIDIDRL